MRPPSFTILTLLSALLILLPLTSADMVDLPDNELAVIKAKSTCSWIEDGRSRILVTLKLMLDRRRCEEYLARYTNEATQAGLSSQVWFYDPKFENGECEMQVQATDWDKIWGPVFCLWPNADEWMPEGCNEEGGKRTKFRPSTAPKPRRPGRPRKYGS